MATDQDDIACARIRDAIVQKFLEMIEVTRVETLPHPAYAFDPEGWEIYYIFRKDRIQVGGGEY